MGATSFLTAGTRWSFLAMFLGMAVKTLDESQGVYHETHTPVDRPQRMRAKCKMDDDDCMLVQSMSVEGCQLSGLHLLHLESRMHIKLSTRTYSSTATYLQPTV
jgi:hypothetical protein